MKIRCKRGLHPAIGRGFLRIGLALIRGAFLVVAVQPEHVQ